MVLAYILVFLGFALLLIGFIGCFLPILPGPPLSYGGMLFIHFSSFADMSRDFLLLWAAVAAFVTILDYYVPVYGAKKFGGTRYGMIGASMGLVVGLFFSPFGLILGPLFGALLGEILSGSHHNALKSAFGTFVGFLFGILLKCIVCIMMIYYSITHLL